MRDGRSGNERSAMRRSGGRLMRSRRTVLASLLLAGAIVGAVAACGSNDQTNVTLTIRRGSSFREAAESLAAHDVVKFPRLFGFYASQRGLDRKIEYGTYLIRRGASWDEILTALQLGKGLVNRVTLIEGLPLWEMIPILSQRLALPTESLEAAVRDTVLLKRVGVPRGHPTLEGYLFPDTYDFPVNINARQAVDLMVRRFERAWKPEWNARLDTMKMTRHEIVTLASIVEKEVRRREEAPVVAAVYLNRLQRRMLLQADPTVQYAQRRRPGRVLYRDLDVVSPYNTYRRAGLPPGPIAAPGLSSLEGSLYPAAVPYLYFVAHPNGTHVFRTTYREHLAAITMVRGQARIEAQRKRDLEAAQKAVGVPRPTAAPDTTKPPND
jgi:UPF0755 protein